MTSADELFEEREFLLRSLDDLERERAAGDLDEADYSALRDEYTARAATVLRAIGDGADRAPRRPPFGRRAAAAVVVLTMVLALGAGWAVSVTSGARVAGQAATGSIGTGTAERLARARELAAKGDAIGAIKVYDRILRNDPRQPEALAYRGWLLHLAGLDDEALLYLDRALEADQAYPDARFFRAFIRYRVKHDAAGAVPDFQAFLASSPPPELRTQVEALLRAAQADAAKAPPPSQ